MFTAYSLEINLWKGKKKKLKKEKEKEKRLNSFFPFYLLKTGQGVCSFLRTETQCLINGCGGTNTWKGPKTQT